MQEIYMPALGMASTDVYLAAWSKQPGDAVSVGDAIAEIETDKAELTVESPGAGILGRHLFEAETSVDSGAIIAYILEPGEADPAGTDDGTTPTPAAAAPIETAPASPAEPARSDSQQTLTGTDRVRDPATGELSPYTLSPRQRAAVLDGSARSATPSASEAAPIASPDPFPVPAPAVPAAPPPRPAETAETAETADDAATDDAAATDRHRAAVARAVSRSWAEIPHFTVSREIRVEKLQTVLASFRALGAGSTLTDVILKAYALSLVERFGTTEINLGLAVATPRGVAIPVLLDVARSDLLGIAAARKAAVSRATEARLAPEDQTVPHSSVSNLGAFGVDSFTGIVPLGQTSLLTVGASRQVPVVENGELAIGTTMNATMNVDHREWDGQHAAEVLRRFAALAAEPTMLLALR